MLTRLLTKSCPSQARMLLGGAIGGIYSLIIFFPSLNVFVTIVGKLLSSCIIVFICFGFSKLTMFIKRLVCFYFSNLVFLGVIVAVILISNSNRIIVNNNSVYFDLSAKLLLLLSLVSYALSTIIIKLYNSTISKKEIYSLTVINDGKSYHYFAFLDSGNRLVEPFSSYPVIIVDKSKYSFEATRLIPYNTVGGEGMLNAFKPDKIIISNGKSNLESDKVYVALGDVKTSEFSAILNPMLLNN